MLLSSLSRWLVPGAFAAGLALGAWATVKLYTADEVEALQAQLDAQRQDNETAMIAVDRFYRKQVADAQDNVKTVEVIRRVKVRAECAVPVDVVRVLEARRQGLFAPAPGAAGNPGAAPGLVGVSERQLYAAYNDLLGRLSACRDQIVGLRDHVQNQ